MIFATVGGQLPFDRMIRVVDTWAGREGRDDVVAQIGDASFRPRNLDAVGALEPDAFRSCVRECRVVVAHAGMGVILTALEEGKPLLVFPRRAAFAETRNDHQVATARRLSEAGLVSAALTEAELEKKLRALDSLPAPTPIPTRAPAELLAVLRDFAFEGRR